MDSLLDLEITNVKITVSMEQQGCFWWDAEGFLTV